MAVVTVTTVTVKPDRFGDFLQDMGRVKTITERCGGRNVRLLTAVVAGEATGTMAFISEADDLAASGAVADKFFADPEGLAVLSSMTSTAGPMAGAYQTAFWLEIPVHGGSIPPPEERLAEFAAAG